MKDVFIAGVGQTRIVQNGDVRGRYMAAEALTKAFDDSNLNKDEVNALYVANMSSGVLGNQQQLGAVVAEAAGLSGKEAVVVEAACASGAAAVRQAYLMVAGGIHDMVAVCGIERMTHPSVNKDDITKALAMAADWELEASKGETFISLNARLMREYMAAYKIKHEAFAPFSINAHTNALDNPNALFHKQVDFETYTNARMIVDPLKLYDISPVCNGAAALIFANEKYLLANGTSRAMDVRVVGSSMATTQVALEKRKSLLHLDAAESATRQVLANAGVALDDIDFFELHDAYTIMSVLSLEAAGFAKPGEGTRLGAEGRIFRNGDLPIATMGGLKARGHPVGATGVYQIVETYLQLSGQAGACQLNEPEMAMVQNIGGAASTVVNHILQRVR